MNGHDFLIHDIAFSCLVAADGGPQRYRERGIALPDKYLPGRYFSRLTEDHQKAIIEAVEMQPAPWVIKKLIPAK